LVSQNLANHRSGERKTKEDLLFTDLHLSATDIFKYYRKHWKTKQMQGLDGSHKRGNLENYVFTIEDNGNVSLGRT
jgi:hypothetical protein